MSLLTFSQAIDEALRAIMVTDGSVVLVGEHNKALSEEFGQRVIEVPFGENIVTSTALGLAMTGAKPIAMIRGEYLLRSLDVIGNEIALTNTMYNGQFDSSIVIRAQIGYSLQSGPQLSQSFEAMFCQFPGLIVIYPSNPTDAQALLKSAVASNKPVLFLENVSLLNEPVEVYDVPAVIGESAIVREGRDVTIVSYGPMVNVCLKASDLAAESGLMCEIIDLRTINPIDINPIISSIKKTGKLIIVHEARKNCGIGAEISAQIVESDTLFYLDSKILRVCTKDNPIPYNKTDYNKAVPNEEDILKAIIQLSTGE
jgi:pyruvate dehydrogenase E1 component beta subunit